MDYLEKSRLIAAHQVALHDSSVLEKGYQYKDCQNLAASEMQCHTNLHQANSKTYNNFRNNTPNAFKLALRPICLQDLKLGKVHRGKILHGTLCCDSVKCSTIMNILEEKDTGNAIRLMIANAEVSSTTEAQNVYPKDTQLSIQEPYLKIFSDRMIGVFVEDPKSIIIHHLCAQDKPVLSRQNQRGEETSYDSESLSNNNRKRLPPGRKAPDMMVKYVRTDREVQANTIYTRKGMKEKETGLGNEEAASPSEVNQYQNEKSNPFRQFRIDSVDQEENGIQDRVVSSSPLLGLSNDQKQIFTVNLVGGSKVSNLTKKIALSKISMVAKKKCATELEPNYQSSIDETSANQIIMKKLGGKGTDGREESKETMDAGLCSSANELEASVVGLKASSEDHHLLSCKSQVNCRETNGSFINLKSQIIDSDGERVLLPSSLRNESSSLSTRGKEGDVKQMHKKTFLEQFQDDQFSPRELRLLGNQQFAQQNWERAIDLYTQATNEVVQTCSIQETKENVSPNCTEPVEVYQYDVDKSISLINKSKIESLRSKIEIVMDYSNRAEVWLRLHHYEKAWADCERALSLDPTHLKSLFRKSRALLGLGDYKQALAHLEIAHSCAPFDKDILVAIQLCQSAYNQSYHGIYDLTQYYLKGRFVGDIPACEDYIGPIQIKQCSEQKRRGLFLTKDVQAGDLILVSNPLVMLEYESRKKNNKRFFMRNGDITQNNPRLDTEIKCKLLKSLQEKVKTSSKNYERVLALFHDNQDACHVPSMDLFIASGQEMSSSTSTVPREPLDKMRLANIIDRNTIDRNMVCTTLKKGYEVCGKKHQNECSGSGDFCFYGLWMLPSFINHSCIPNVSPLSIGRALFVYASKDLKCNEEVVINYFNIFQPMPQRREIASTCWGFLCNCARCSFEASLKASIRSLYALHIRLEPYPTFLFQLSSLGYKALAKDIVRELELIEDSQNFQTHEKIWLRGSYIQLYIVNKDVKSAHQNPNYLEAALLTMMSICPSSSYTLQVGLLARENVRQAFGGTKTSQYKSINQQLRRVCKCIYGKQRRTVLQSLVDGTSTESSVKRSTVPWRLRRVLPSFVSGITTIQDQLARLSSTQSRIITAILWGLVFISVILSILDHRTTYTGS